MRGAAGAGRGRGGRPDHVPQRPERGAVVRGLDAERGTARSTSTSATSTATSRSTCTSPVGPDNNVQPGGPDRGQPTWFLPRRNLNVFTVTVPADFGDGEIVWTLTANGKTERAFASLIPEFILDQRVIFRQYTGFDVQGDLEHNRIPTVMLEGAAAREATVGTPLALTGAGRRRRHPGAAGGRRRAVPGHLAGAAGRLVRVPRRRSEGCRRPAAVQAVSRLQARLAVDARVAASPARRGTGATRCGRRSTRRHVRPARPGARRRLGGERGRDRQRALSAACCRGTAGRYRRL